MSDGKIVIEADLETKKFDAQLNALEQKLDSEMRALERLENIKATDGLVIDQKKLNAEISRTKVNIEKTSNEIINLKARIRELNSETDNFNGVSTKTFDKGVSRIKRFALALFGIRSIYALVSRASSAYLAQDTEMANKLQSTWAALGSFLAPLVEWISNLMAKLVGYLNVFVQALTGVDYIAKNNARALGAQAKAQKELNKQMFAFDEVNKFSDTSAGAGASVGGGAFVTPELDDRIVKKLQDLAYWIKENWSWLKLLGEMFLVVFGAYQVAKILSGISRVIGSAGSLTGLAGLSGLLQGILAIGAIALTIYIVGNTIKEVKQLKEDLKNLRKNGSKAQAEYIKNQNDINQLVRDEEANRAANVQQLEDCNSWLYKMLGLGDEGLKDAKMVVKQSENFLKKEMEIYAQGKLNEEQKKKLLDNLIKQYNYNVQIIRKLEEQGKDTSELRRINDQYVDSIKTVGNNLDLNDDKLNEMVRQTADADKFTKGMYDNLKNYNYMPLENKSATYYIGVNVNTAEAKRNFKSLWDYFDALAHGNFSGGGSYTGGGGGGGGHPFAVGGIYNNPGKGVSLGPTAYAGEAGREGVLPLTDPSTMSELGAEIGKWVTINNYIDNYVDSRKVNRIMATSNSRQNIMKNG